MKNVKDLNDVLKELEFIRFISDHTMVFMTQLLKKHSFNEETKQIMRDKTILHSGIKIGIILAIDSIKDAADDNYENINERLFNSVVEIIDSNVEVLLDITDKLDESINRDEFLFNLRTEFEKVYKG